MTYDEIIEQLEITKSKIKEIARNEYGGESWNDDLDALTEAADIVADYSKATAQAWFGQEILDHSEGCVDLTRLNEIGCVLFNHDRDEVIGKITKAWIDNGRGMATIEFDSDEASEVIYQKVKGGTLKGVSVGYLVDDWEEVMPNKTSTDGRFMGPCSIAKKWAPYEISIVSVPADPTVGVGREMEEKSEPGTQDIPLDIYERQLQINKNRMEVKENDD